MTAPPLIPSVPQRYDPVNETAFRTALDRWAAQVTQTTAPLVLRGYAVADLPAGIQGQLAFATNLLAPAFLGVAVGGGLVVGPVFFDGTNWVTI